MVKVQFDCNKLKPWPATALDPQVSSWSRVFVLQAPSFAFRELSFPPTLVSETAWLEWPPFSYSIS